TAVVRRFAGQWDSVKRILTYCDEAHFFGNDNGFVEVAEYKENILTIKSNQIPLWVNNLIEVL
ncbi:MAG: hypothetical protein LBC71_05575, partial [Oscillospiraceae bacterium]|nr:hypothetical protein [Oscillospiraceae bacterium]